MVHKEKKSKETKKRMNIPSVPIKISDPQCDYDHDFYQWITNQTKLLKKKAFSQLDIDNLIEEIESLGKSDKRALISHLIVLLTHLLKIKYQQGKHTASWDRSINNSSTNIMLLLKDSPSLRKQLIHEYEDAYTYARKIAIKQTKLDESTFPTTPPWPLNQVLDL